MVLQDSNKQWVTDDATLQDMAVSYFCNLYYDDSNSFSPLCSVQGFKKISMTDNDAILRGVNMDELLQVIKSMGSYKAPGIDGLQPIFFQSQWSMVGPSVCSLVLNFLTQVA